MPLLLERKRREGILCVLFVGLFALAGCQTGSSTHEELAPEDDAPYFTAKEFGVAASPRMVRTKRVPKGGGRDQTGKPYQVRGKWYYPKEEPGYVKTGTASWYGSNFHGRLTANGEIYDMYHLSAAHPTFPLPSYAKVTNRRNGASVLVRVNDRGPYMHGRVLDVSQRAADLLDFRHDGIADVKVEYVGRAPLEGDDTKMLMASYHQGSARPVDMGLPSGVMVAEARPSFGSRFASLFGRGKDSTPEPTAGTMVAASAVQARTPAIAATALESAERPSPSVGGSPTPVVPATSVEDLIQTYDAAALPSVPVPGNRSMALGYASPNTRTQAHAAMRSLMSNVAGPASGRERIEIGQIADVEALVRVADVLADYRLIDGSPGGSPELVELAPGQDADELLKRLWAAGATDAFTLRD